MYYIATYDVGTTAVKGVLVSSDGEIKTSELVQIKTYFQQDYKEQKPDDWFDAFCQIGKKFTSHVGADKIKAVIMSGQMQDLILVDEAGRPLRDAILYSDARAGLEAAKIQARAPSKFPENYRDGPVFATYGANLARAITEGYKTTQTSGSADGNGSA